MHKNSFKLMSDAVEDVCRDLDVRPISVLDIGSRIVASEKYSYAQIFNESQFKYIGADVVEGENVNLILKNPYVWDEVDSNSYDLVLSGQVLEHVPLFWEVWREMSRVTRPGGFLLIIVPSKGAIHRYPVDCYRFMPDGLRSLADWLGLEVISLTFDPGSYWGDVMLVARKPLLSRATAEIRLTNSELEKKIRNIPRVKRIGQISISVVAIIIGDYIFELIVDKRNAVRKRMSNLFRK